MTTRQRVLIVEDDDGLGVVIAGLLGQVGYEATHVLTAEAGLAQLELNVFDAVLTDLRLPGLDGFGFLKAAKARAPELPVLMLTAHASVPLAVEAMRLGAADFLQKPFEREEVLYSLEKAVRLSQRLAAEPPRLEVAAGLVGASGAIVASAEDMARAAKATATVLIRGESGTGKEVAARSIHTTGDRRDRPFIAVHCAALPEQLLESELFGYEKGAFTGATQNKPGRVELAEGGTLFLDEIGDVSRSVQVKLLRLLQEKEYQPLGAVKPRKANVRIIAATHRDLDAMVASGEFREDLYYRLNVLPIWLPPLRDRGRDIEHLARHFLERLGQENGRAQIELSAEAVSRLLHHDWPGNVRELENIMERLVVFTDAGVIESADVERELSRSGPRASSTPSPPAAGQTLEAQRDAADRRAIEEALARAGGNRAKAARLLGISRRTLYNRLADLGL